MRLPRSGEQVLIGREASVQFALCPMVFRIIRIHDWPTYEGWIWLDGYQLDRTGEAVERRSIFVMIDGLAAMPRTPAVPRTDVRARNSGRVADNQRRGAPAASTVRR